MCNPPFYASKEEATHSSAAKALLPSAVRFFHRSRLQAVLRPSSQICTGADVEMITPGGEEAFVGRMVNESITLGERCRYVPSLLTYHLPPLLLRIPLQVVHLYARQAIISDGSRDAPPHPLGIL